MVGRIDKSASAEPRLVALILMRRSSELAFASSVITSKKRFQPRPIGRCAVGHDYVERNPMACRKGCSPRGQCPTAARTDKVPSASNALCVDLILRDVFLQSS